MLTTKILVMAVVRALHCVYISKSLCYVSHAHSSFSNTILLSSSLLLLFDININNSHQEKKYTHAPPHIPVRSECESVVTMARRFPISFIQFKYKWSAYTLYTVVQHIHTPNYSLPIDEFSCSKNNNIYFNISYKSSILIFIRNTN